jgi:hypothetical protein
MNLKHLFLISAIVLSAVSCEIAEISPGISGDGFCATLESHSGVSRTTLSGSSVLWTEGDTIVVFKSASTADSHLFVLDPADDGKANGHFSEAGFEEYYSSACYAFYPAAMAGTPSGTVLAVNLPPVQYYREGSFDRNANPALAVSKGDGKLAFKNLCGLISVAVKTAEAISEVKLTTAAEEALWGAGTVDMASSPKLVMDKPVSEAQKSLVMKVYKKGDDGQFVNVGPASATSDGVLKGDDIPTQVFWFVVPVGTLAQGFTVTTTTTTGKCMQKYAVGKASNAIERSVCTVMPGFIFEDESEVEIRTDVPNKAFYKDLFADAGTNLSKYKTMPVVPYLGLSYEYFYTESYTSTLDNTENLEQAKVFIGNPDDLNGVLLYPDGEPRFKMLYENGGYSTTHGRALWAGGRDNIRKFFYNGGSYVGSCAGAFFSSRGVIDNDYTSTSGYLGLWPGYVNNTNVYDIYPDYILPDDSPLLKYYDFGGDRRVAKVMHWNGPYFEEYDMVPGTEVLCINDYPAYKYHMLPSVIAYKPSVWSGRVIPSGGHPEQYKDGEVRDLMAAYVKYAFDGVGIAKAKGVLHNGEVRRMTKSTTDEDPAYTKVGDKQCHHFVFALPDGARNICVRLESLDDFNISLHLANGTFAFKEDAQYKVENTDKVKELKFDSLPKGTWYVGVQCEDTPTCTLGDYSNGKYSGYQYSGNIAVLNGAPYTISVTWE